MTSQSLVQIYSRKIENRGLLDGTFKEYMKLLNFQSRCFFEEEYLNNVYPNYIKALQRTQKPMKSFLDEQFRNNQILSTRELENTLLYSRTLFYMKIWEGEQIKEEDFIHFCPFTSEYVRILLESKFKRKFSDDQPSFRREIQSLSKMPLPIRTDNFLNFLIAQSLKFSKSQEISHKD